MAKKNTKDDIQCLRDAQEQLLKAFVEYKTDTAKKSNEQYRQLVNALSILQSDTNTSNKVRNFWDLIPKLIAAGKKEENRRNRLLKALKDANDNHTWGTSKKSYKTYINQFIVYIDYCQENKIKL